MSRPLVIYHANCADGFCSAWTAHRFFGTRADYLPAQYGDPPPDVTDRDVYILDFSYKRPVLEEMVDACRTMVLRDHHKTAEADLLPLDSWSAKANFRFDMTKSGGRLSWEFFFPEEPAPWLVDYTEDRDLWRWKLEHSREINAAISSYPFDFAKWDAWVDPRNHFSVWCNILSTEGEAILRYQQQQVDNICKNAWEQELDGHRVLCANTPILQSEVAGALAEGRPFGMTFFVRPDGKKVYSLRSRSGGIDVSEIARAHGGGGHFASSGYEESLA